MPRLLFSVIFLGALLHLDARELRGMVTGQSGEPIEFVSIGLFKTDESKPTVVSVTDSLGRFNFDDIAGATILKASLVGMENVSLEIGTESYIALVMSPRIKQLREVTVSDDDRIVNGRMVTYRPAKNVKAASAGGYELLDGMALDNVMVDALEKKVETAWGENIGLFINYLPATSNDISNLLPADVKKVEYIDFPTDIRFKGNNRVINIILDAYRLGGYTKMAARQYFVNNRGDYSVASKLTYKRVIYDLAAGYGYRKPSHYRNEDLREFDFGDQTIKRTEKTDHSREITENPYSTLRMVYYGEKTAMSNTVGFSFDHNPESVRRGAVDFSSVYKSGRFDRSDRSRAATTSWQGEYYFELPRNYMLLLSGNATYTRRHNHTFYSADGADAIVNNAHEDAWSVTGEVAANKQFGIFNIGYSMMASDMHNNLGYNGTSTSDSRMKQTLFSSSPSVDVSLGNVSLNARIGFNYRDITTNKKSDGNFTVNPHVSLLWNPSRKISAQLSLYRLTYSFNVAWRSPDVIKRSEIEWTTGNPGLKNYCKNDIILSTRYTLSRSMTLALNLKYSYTDNAATYRWIATTDTENRPVMVQSFMNSGSFSEFSPTVSLTGRFLKRSLVTSLQMMPAFYRQTGQRHLDKSVFTWVAKVTYYKSKFNIGANYSSRTRLYNSFMVSNIPATYNFFIGYSHKNLVVRAYAINLLSNSWKGGCNVTKGDIFYNRDQRYYPQAHRHFLVSIAYSLSYGKKVDTEEALKRVEATESGIIK